LQEILAKMEIKLREFGITGLKPVTNEMESSALFRIAGEYQGHRTGTVCAILANRAEGEFITPEGYTKAVDGALLIGLETLARESKG
jgi:uridine phosphorylase